MPSPDRLTTPADGLVIACPECDAAGDVYRRRRSNTHIGDPDDPLACGACSATFERVVLRESRQGVTAGDGTPAKYEHLSPEDVGL